MTASSAHASARSIERAEGVVNVADAVQKVRSVVEREAAATDAAASFPTAALDALRASGLMGLLVPERWGGLGGTVRDLVDATIELGRSDMSVAIIFAMHAQQVAVVVRFGSDRLRDTILPDVAAGRVYVGSVTTEPTGTGILDTQSAVVPDGDELVLDRDAPVVTGGAHADAFLVTMRGSGGGVALMWAGREQLAVSPNGDWQPLGMRATDSGGLHLAGRVPAWQVLDVPGGFRTIAAEVFAPMAHLGWAAAWLGTAAGALSRVVRHLRHGAGRRRFDPSSELALSRLATVRSRIDVTHALLRHAVHVYGTAVDVTATPVQLLLNSVKVRAAEECFAAVDELIELVGLRHGYFADSETGLERAFRDLRSASLNFGNDRLRLTNGALALMDPEVCLG